MAVTTTQLVHGDIEIWKCSGFAALNDVSNPIPLPKHSDVTVHALGTFTGALSLALQGSNEYDVNPPTSWIALRDSNETVIALTAADLVQVLESPVWMRVNATAGTGGAAVTVYIKAVRRR